MVAPMFAVMAVAWVLKKTTLFYVIHIITVVKLQLSLCNGGLVFTMSGETPADELVFDSLKSSPIYNE